MSWPNQGRYGRLTQPDCYPELQDIPANILFKYHGADPKHITKLTGTIVYCQIGEYLRDDNITELLSANDCDYIFIVPHKVSAEIIAKYKSRASFIFPRYAYAYYSKNLEYYPDQFNRVIQTKKDRYFLSLNNRATWYRQALYYAFQNFKLIDHSYFSYIGARSWVRESDIDFAGLWYTDQIDLNYCDQQIPLRTGLDNFEINDWTVGNIKYYADTFLSIVTETYSAEQYPFFTEKLFKPMAFGHPFLVHANQGSLAKLQEMGFQTFDNCLDNNYDNYIDQERFELMLKEILRIARLSLDDINDLYTDLRLKLEHNYNHFTKELPLLYNTEIPFLREQILDLL